VFKKATLDFLDELANNNTRAWFEENKARYESLVREPALDFIEAMAPALKSISPHFRADTRKKVGGSLMRVFRDTRFSRDKTPYKTNIGIQFRHDLGKDVHAPGFYVNIANGDCFLGAGCWHPEPDALGRIRDLIAAKPAAWAKARDHERFATCWTLAGDSLTRPPRGYAADHAEIEDIKRKDFIGLSPLSARDITPARLVDVAATRFAAASSLVEFLCRALDVPY